METTFLTFICKNFFEYMLRPLIGPILEDQDMKDQKNKTQVLLASATFKKSLIPNFNQILGKHIVNYARKG